MCSPAGFLLGCRGGPQPVGHGGIGIEIDQVPCGRTAASGLAAEPAWAGTVCVTVVDTFSRRIVGWSAATTKQTELVLAAVEMGLWQHDREGHRRQNGRLIRHSDAGSQYASFAPTEHLQREGIAASTGSVGDAYGNALMESTIGLFKTEPVKPRRSWKTLPDVVLATASTGTTTTACTVK